MFTERRNVGDSDGMTFREIQEKSGIGKYVLRALFQDLKRQGRLKAGREYREAMDGMMRIVPVYWLSLEELEKDE
jgi:hypothetical protein